MVLTGMTFIHTCHIAPAALCSKSRVLRIFDKRFFLKLFDNYCEVKWHLSHQIRKQSGEPIKLSPTNVTYKDMTAPKEKHWKVGKLCMSFLQRFRVVFG